MISRARAFAGIAILVLLGILSPAAARAAVVDSSASGFTIVISDSFASAPAAVYKAFVDIGSWWDPEHTFSGSAKNMRIETKPGGCFCERLKGGGWIRHMDIIYAEPGKMLRMSGGLGPLQERAVTGTMTVKFDPIPSGSRLEMTYAAGGYLPQGVASWAGVIDLVLSAQVRRFAQHVNRATAKP